MKYKTFETDRLLFKPTLTDDAAFILALFNTPAWIRYIADRNIRTVEAAEKYIQDHMVPQFERLGYGCYTLIRKTDQTKIGICGLFDRAGVAGIDIGFGFLPGYEKHGYGFEAASRLKEAAVHNFGLKTISAITAKDNIPSQKLIEKLGLTLKGTTILPETGKESLLYTLEL